MAETTAIVSSIVMGVFLLVIAAALSRATSRPVFTSEDSDESTWSGIVLDSLTEWIRNPGVWALGFVLLSCGLGAGVLLYVGDGPIADASRAAAGVVIAGILAAVICAFLFFGVYITAKSKGRSTAWGVAEGVIALGLVFVVAIMANLIVS
jgi:hypothetical protein